MEGRLSTGSGDRRRCRWSGVAWERGGRFPGRHGLKVRRVRPVWSGSYARAGYLKTLVRRRVPILRSGAALPGAGLPIALVRAPVDGDVAAFVVAHARPGGRWA